MAISNTVTDTNKTGSVFPSICQNFYLISWFIGLHTMSTPIWYDSIYNALMLWNLLREEIFWQNLISINLIHFSYTKIYKSTGKGTYGCLQITPGLRDKDNEQVVAM